MAFASAIDRIMLLVATWTYSGNDTGESIRFRILPTRVGEIESVKDRTRTVQVGSTRAAKRVGLMVKPIRPKLRVGQGRKGVTYVKNKGQLYMIIVTSPEIFEVGFARAAIRF